MLFHDILDFARKDSCRIVPSLISNYVSVVAEIQATEFSKAWYFWVPTTSVVLPVIFCSI